MKNNRSDDAADRRYFVDLITVIHQLGVIVGPVLILLSAPGIIALYATNDFTHVSGPIRVGVALMSGAFCAIGVCMTFVSIRISAYIAIRSIFQRQRSLPRPSENPAMRRVAAAEPSAAQG